MQEFVLAKIELLLEALVEVSIPTSEPSDISSEMEAEIWREAKIGVEVLHSDMVVTSDVIDPVSVVSIPKVIFGSELIVGLSISLLIGLIVVAPVWCSGVGLDGDSIVGCTDDVIPGTKI